MIERRRRLARSRLLAIRLRALLRGTPMHLLAHRLLLRRIRRCRCDRSAA